MSHEPHGDCTGQAGCNTANAPVPQIWFCEKCCTVGVVMYRPDEDAWSVGNKVRAAHLKYRPKCRYSERVIVVENLKTDAILCTGRD